MPERMTVKQYSFTASQIISIKDAAAVRECSEAAVARLAVDKFFGLSSESREGPANRAGGGIGTPAAGPSTTQKRV